MTGNIYDEERLYKEVRGILDNLTPQNFQMLMNKFMLLPINSEERLNGVINLIYDKAVDEPNFTKACANLSKICSKMEVAKIENGQEQKVNFRKILVTRCQSEFESSKSSDLDTAKRLEEFKNCTDPEQKKELQLEYEERERAIQRRSVGNIRFTGELFNMGMLTPAIMYRCIDHLLMNPDEKYLECLFVLLTTIGKELEKFQRRNDHPQHTIIFYFQKMAELHQKPELSWKVRSMLHNVLELRQNKWVPKGKKVSDCKKRRWFFRKRANMKNNQTRSGAPSFQRNKKWVLQKRLSFLPTAQDACRGFCDIRGAALAGIDNQPEMDEELQDNLSHEVTHLEKDLNSADTPAVAHCSNNSPPKKKLCVTKPEEKPDELDLFFKSITSTVRSFPLHLKQRAKLETLSLISTIEMEMSLNHPNSIHTPPNISGTPSPTHLECSVGATSDGVFQLPKDSADSQNPVQDLANYTNE